MQPIGIVGAGTIGASWAASFLAHGHRAIVYDPSPGAPDLVRTILDRAWPVLSVHGLPEGASRDNITFVDDIAALAPVGFVQESGPERLDVKIDLFQRIEGAIDPEVVIASSSSGLLISDIQTHCTHPGRCLIGHPFNPPHLVPLVEIVRGAETTTFAVDTALALYRSLGKRPIVVDKEVPGHVANRLQAAVLREVVHLLLTEVASLEDIEQALVYGPGMRWAAMGSLLTFHLGGGEGGIEALLRHLGGPIQSWWDDLGRPDLTPEVKAAVEKATLEMVGTRSIADLSARRDEFLVRLAEIQPGLYDR